MKKNMFFVVFFLLSSLILNINLIFSTEVLNLYTEKCSDGTAYWQCSQTKPGYGCLPDSSSSNGVSLQNDLQTKLIKDSKTGQHKCACQNFPGYTEQNGECVKTTCEYNGKTIENGKCLDDKPKRCVSGSIVDDPSSCGCPIGKEVSPDKKTCQSKVGCRWGTVVCNQGYKCEYLESNINDDGKCVGLSGCADIIPQEKRIKCTSLEYCDTSSDPKGQCVQKKGCQYLNPPCSKEETCNTETGLCEKIQSNSLNLSSKSQTSSNQQKGFSTLQCCCLPAGGFVAISMLVFLRKKKN
ncbi:MAG: hypothetical protein ACK4J0_02270 [Candidatus Anstonellaceae archaeon]